VSGITDKQKLFIQTCAEDSAEQVAKYIDDLYEGEFLRKGPHKEEQKIVEKLAQIIYHKTFIAYTEGYLEAIDYAREQVKQ